MTSSRYTFSIVSTSVTILGDPGAVSGGGEKSKNGRKKIRANFSPPPLTAPRSPRMNLRESQDFEGSNLGRVKCSGEMLRKGNKFLGPFGCFKMKCSNILCYFYRPF